MQLSPLKPRIAFHFNFTEQNVVCLSSNKKGNGTTHFDYRMRARENRKNVHDATPVLSTYFTLKELLIVSTNKP